MVKKISKMNEHPKHRTPKVQSAEQDVLAKFRVIFKSIKKHFHWVEQQTGVNGAQLWVLAVIAETPGIKVKELAKALSIHQSTASNLIDRLVKQGLIRRERSEEDQRVVHLFAEARGRKLIKTAPKPLQGVLPDALNHMSATDLIQLNLLLAKLVGKMKIRDNSGKSTPLANI